MLDFLEVEALWWHEDNILATFRAYAEADVKSALTELIDEGLVTCDNQRPPWYVASQWE